MDQNITEITAVTLGQYLAEITAVIVGQNLAEMTAVIWAKIWLRQPRLHLSQNLAEITVVILVKITAVNWAKIFAGITAGISAKYH